MPLLGGQGINTDPWEILLKSVRKNLIPPLPLHRDVKRCFSLSLPSSPALLSETLDSGKSSSVFKAGFYHPY